MTKIGQLSESLQAIHLRFSGKLHRTLEHAVIVFFNVILFCSFIISNVAFGKTISNPHFYSLVAPNGKQSFILGTIHGGVEISDLPNQIIQKFNESSLFVNEWAFSGDEVAAVLGGRIVDEQLKKFIHKGDDISFEIKHQLVADWGIDSRFADTIKRNDCSILSFGGPISSGYMDFHFLDMARKQNKKTLSLDTQVELDKLKQLNPTQPCEIRNILNQVTPSQFKSYQLNIIAEYRSGTIPVQDDDPMTNGRNQFWLSTISNNLNSGSVFIAVGVDHLYGSHGLLQLLQQFGYQVTRVP